MGNIGQKVLDAAKQVNTTMLEHKLPGRILQILTKRDRSRLQALLDNARACKQPVRDYLSLAVNAMCISGDHNASSILDRLSSKRTYKLVEQHLIVHRKRNGNSHITSNQPLTLVGSIRVVLETIDNIRALMNASRAYTARAKFSLCVASSAQLHPVMIQVCKPLYDRWKLNTTFSPYSFAATAFVNHKPIVQALRHYESWQWWMHTAQEMSDGWYAIPT